MNVKELSGRFVMFGANIIDLTQRVCKTPITRSIAAQLIRSATSTSANFYESRSAESKADFIHELQVALKECRETYYWLLIIKSADLFPPDDGLDELIDEGNQLTAILVSSVRTSKSATKPA